MRQFPWDALEPLGSSAQWQQSENGTAEGHLCVSAQRTPTREQSATMNESTTRGKVDHRRRTRIHQPISAEFAPSTHVIPLFPQISEHLAFGALVVVRRVAPDPGRPRRVNGLVNVLLGNIPAQTVGRRGYGHSVREVGGRGGRWCRRRWSWHLG